MMYEVKYDPKAERQLDKLPKDIAARIVTKISEVSEAGRGIESIKEKKFGYKIRVGDYRVLVDITYNPNIIWVRYVGHRKKIYKRV